MAEGLGGWLEEKGGWGLMARLRWREGGMEDYEALAEFHYLRSRPGTATRVIVVEYEGSSKFEGYMRVNGTGVCCGRNRIVGVLVESYPALGCQLREEALGGRYSGWGDRGAAARLLNEEVRCVSRVVVHPQWRGLGLGVALVREAIAGMRTVYMEALASMGRVHPFFRLAGMREYCRMPHARDRRLQEALEAAGLKVWMTARVAWMERWIGGEGENGTEVEKWRRELVREELGRWAGRGKGLGEQLRMARDRLHCEPRYYLKMKEEKDDG